MYPPKPPTFALVLWPDAYDKTLPSCIYISGLEDARQRGGLVIAVEDAEMCAPVQVFNAPRVIPQADGDSGNDAA